MGMPYLRQPDSDMHPSFLQAMAEMQAEGRGAPDDESSVGDDLRRYAATWHRPDASLGAPVTDFDDSGSPRVVGRVGDTVVRRTGHWTPAVHELLRHLEQVGFPYSPRVLNIDEHGHEVLSYLDGASGKAGWAQVVPEAGLRSFARLLRDYHDAVAGFRPVATSGRCFGARLHRASWSAMATSGRGTRCGATDVPWA